MKVAEAIEINIANDETLISIDAAVQKYGLSEHDAKRLRGKIFMRGEFDPFGSLERGVVHDDRRLQRFVESLRAANKSSEVQP